MAALSPGVPSTSGSERTVVLWQGGGLCTLCILLAGKALTNLLLIVLSPAHLSSCWGCTGQSKHGPVP